MPQKIKIKYTPAAVTVWMKYFRIYQRKMFPPQKIC